METFFGRISKEQVVASVNVMLSLVKQRKSAEEVTAQQNGML